SALDDIGIAHAGAGRNSREARGVGLLEVSGETVALLPCTTVGPIAGPDQPGARSCRDSQLVPEIAALAGEAGVVIVFPHWGREYRTEPADSQRHLARRWVAAGADLVLGAHSHWAGAIEEIDDRLVFYSMGDLTFDQPWSEATMQGLIVELTFVDDRLVQAWLHPTLIVEDVQPNLLEFDAGGSKVLKRMRDASADLLGY
ncbi:MAG TPA: CapA family protein, partial [Candidatus Caenarcaniphilales bacterium]|nr:CapA family protein [Candidatus Caenarcaniphilales bacterium]